MKSPLVSVVMAAYNAGEDFHLCIESILQQQGVSLEFIIVNDGSTDNTQAVAERYAAKDDRVKLINQDNTGLTSALITGCTQAVGKYIARQDAGDISLTGRLLKQASLLEKDESVVLASVATQFLAPEGEKLYVYQPNDKQADESLRQENPEKLCGPPHPCTMFRRDDYLSVGGYRSEFQVAQDLDLWVRLAQLGRHAVVPSVLYEMKLAATGISSLRANEQLDAKRVIAACVQARRLGEGENDLLKQLGKKIKQSNVFSRLFAKARFYFFIGSCFKQSEKASKRKYFLKSIQSNPLFFRSWFRLAQSLLF